MNPLDVKRENHRITIRQQKLSILNKQKRNAFISQHIPQFASSQYWQNLIAQLLKTKNSDALPILKSLKSLSNNQFVIQTTPTIETLKKLLQFMVQQYDMNEEQYIVSWILSNITYRKDTSNLLLHQTNAVQQLIRRFKIIGNIQVKENCLWILNNLQQEDQNFAEHLIKQDFVRDLIVYFKQQPQSLPIFQALRSIILIIHKKQNKSFLDFQPLLTWMFRFIAFDQKQITYHCIKIISMFLQMNYGQLVLLEIAKLKNKNFPFMTRIATQIKSFKNIDKPNQNMFIESFLFIVIEYNRNESNLTQLLQIDIIRLFRIVMDIKGLNTQVFYSLFLAIQQMMIHHKIIQLINKDELLKKMIDFYLSKQSPLHIVALKPVLICILQLAKIKPDLNLLQVSNKLEKDMKQIDKNRSQSKQQQNILLLMQSAIAHITNIYDQIQ